MARSGRSLYLRVGMLVVVGAALGIGFILFLTSGGFGSRQVVFETYVRESVAGLEVGAPVRFRGVAVGRVTELGLVSVIYGVSDGGVDDAANRLVLIRFALDPRRYGNTSVDEAVRAGLRVRMASTGVTGVSYLEADFVNPERFPPIEVPWRPAFPYIPSIPSTIRSIAATGVRNSCERSVSIRRRVDSALASRSAMVAKLDATVSSSRPTPGIAIGVV